MFGDIDIIQHVIPTDKLETQESNSGRIFVLCDDYKATDHAHKKGRVRNTAKTLFYQILTNYFYWNILSQIIILWIECRTNEVK